MKKIYTIIAAFLLALLSAGCYEDLGNYDFREIGGVEATFPREIYSVLRGDSLKVDPVLKFSPGWKDEDFSYAWEAILLIQSGGVENERRFLLGEGRELRCAVTIPDRGEPYKLYLYVTEKATGVRHYFNTRLEVCSSVSSGWLVLCDDQGMSRMDIVSMNENDTVVINDILTKIDAGMPSLKGPLSIGFCRDGTPYRYVVNTISGSYMVDSKTLVCNQNSNIKWLFFTEIPDGFYCHRQYFSAATYYTVSGDSNFYYMNPNTIGAGFGEPVNRFASEPEKMIPVLPDLALCGNNTAKRFLYDPVDKRFILHDGVTAMYCKPVPHDKTNTLFEYRNVGKDLVALINTNFVVAPSKNRVTYAIFRDEAKTWLYVFEVLGKYKQYYAQELPKEAHSSRLFTMDNQSGILYYSDGKALYGWHPLNNQAVMDVGVGFAPEEEVTYLGLQGKLLVVGTYSAAGGNSGKLSFYTADQVNGKLTFSGESYEKLGKIIDISLKK